MKQFSTVLNIFLLAAVAVLYYLHFTSNKKSNAAIQNITTGKHAKDSCGFIPVIAYVEIDSLNSNVDFIRIQKKELEAEQKTIATEYENSYHQLENERNNFLKRGNAITQKEGEEFQQKLIQQQQEIEGRKQNRAQQLAEKGSRVMEDMQTTLKNFLTEYNADRKYTYILSTGSGFDFLFYKDPMYNITPEIVKGLNEKMNQKIKK